MIDTDGVDRTLELARVELAPSAADRARGRAGLGLPQRQVKASVAERPASSPGSWGALRASGKLGVGIGLLIAAGGFGSGYWTALRSVSPSPVGASAAASLDAWSEAPAATHAAANVEPAVKADVAPAPALPSAPSEAPVRTEGAALPARDREPARREAASQRKRPAPIAPAPAVGDELSLLRRVERALRADDPALALALLRELDDRFPDTTLSEERSAAAVLARCALSEPGARLRAESFLRDRPASVYVERVRAACQLPSVRSPRVPGEGSARRGYE